MAEGSSDVTVLAQLHREAAELLSVERKRPVGALWEDEAGEIADDLVRAVRRGRRRCRACR